MLIQVSKSDRPKYGTHMADCKSMPGSPPLGFGNSPEEAVANLFQHLIASVSYRDLLAKCCYERWEVKVV